MRQHFFFQKEKGKEEHVAQKSSRSHSNAFANNLNIVHMSQAERRSWVAHKGPKNTTASGRHLPDRTFTLADAVGEGDETGEGEGEGEDGHPDRMNNLTRRRLRAAHGIATSSP